MTSRHVLQGLVLAVCLMAQAPVVAAPAVTEGSPYNPRGLPATGCLPPGLPPLDTLHAGPRRLHILTPLDESDDLGPVVLVVHMYADEAGHIWNVGTIRGIVVIVDDHMEDELAKDWWLDGGMLTDGVPPRLQPTARSTCQFHRRGGAS